MDDNTEVINTPNEKGSNDLSVQDTSDATLRQLQNSIAIASSKSISLCGPEGESDSDYFGSEDDDQGGMDSEEQDSGFMESAFSANRLFNDRPSSDVSRLLNGSLKAERRLDRGM